MANDVTVTNFPLEKSHYRVAYDLMKEISKYEAQPTPQNAREHFLTLYRQCYQVIYNGKTLDEITKPKHPNQSGVFFSN